MHAKQFSPRLTTAAAIVPVDPTQLDLPDALVTKFDRIVREEANRTGKRADMVRIELHDRLVEVLSGFADRWEK